MAHGGGAGSHRSSWLEKTRFHAAPPLAATAAVFALTAAVALTGCGAGEGAAVWTGTRDTVGSVEVVRNPGTPLYDTTAVEVEQLWIAPARPDRERLGLWQRPVEVRTSASRVYVLDRMAHHVYAVDAATGEWLRTIGDEGGGPGEFQDPFGLAVDAGRIVVGNGGGASLEVFDTAGAYLRTIRADVMGFGVRALGDGRYMVNGLRGRDGGSMILGPEGGIEPFAFPEPATEPPYGYDRCGDHRFRPAGGRLAQLTCYTPVLYLADIDGRLTREVHIDRPPRAPDPAALDSIIAERRRVMAASGLPAALIDRQTETFRDEFRYIPLFDGHRFDAATARHTLLEHTPVDLGGGPPTVHVIGPDGAFLASIPFDREWVDYDTDGSTLFALVRDPRTGLVRLTAYRYAYPGSRPG